MKAVDSMRRVVLTAMNPAGRTVSLRQVTPFAALPEATLKAVEGTIEHREFPRGAALVSAGEPVGGLFVVLSGRVAFYLDDGRGGESLVGEHRAGEFFGEASALSGEPLPVSVRAAEDSTCLVIPREVFTWLLQEPAFAGFFGRILAERLKMVYRDVLSEQYHEPPGSDSEPFRGRVREVMTAPPVTCFPEEPLTEAARRMSRRGIGSLLVQDREGWLAGLLTERDLTARVVADGLCPNGLRVADAMSQGVVVEAEDRVYQALLSMIRHGVTHLAVTEGGRPAGVVSLRDLLRSRASDTLSVVERIERETSPQGLAGAAREADRVLHALVRRGSPPKRRARWRPSSTTASPAR